MKLLTKFTLALALGSMTMVPLSSSVTTILASQAITVTAPQREMSLGASLTAQEAEQTKQLLGAGNLPIDNTIYVDGNIINKYLQDGSNSNTGVFSSALIEKLPEGSGVQVQVITPTNILLVKPTTYQNAAITSGAKDVLIKIATVKPVTGEGALAGVYALFEKAGLTVDRKAIVVAEKEIQLVEQAKQQTQVTDAQINMIIAEIKTQITNQLVNKQPVDINLIVENVLKNHPDIKLSPDTIEVLKQVAKEYSETEAAKNKDTVGQLENSINDDANKPYAVDLKQFGGVATFKRDGMNIPNPITVSLLDQRVYFGLNQAAAKITTENIETKEITAIAPDGTSRQVKVNTAIHLADMQGTSPGSNEDLYLFFNKEGTISLLTPNYAGNGGGGGMLEYILGEAPVAEEVTEATPENYPYMVDLGVLNGDTSFTRAGMNIPTNIKINTQELLLSYIYPDSVPLTANVLITNIPTQEIRLASADGSGIRNVKVNTVIRSSFGDGNLFLFINANGGVSLATPNYAGNVEEADKDVMLEYLVGETPVNVPEVTEAPVTEAPVTEAPVTEAPVTEAPTTEVPVTEAPVTEAPTTEAPVTEAPVTEAPTTEAPVTEAESFPYMVDLANLPGETPFYSEGMNIPNNIKLNLEAGTIAFVRSADVTENGTITATNISTKEIRLASADGSGIRNVKVNTALQPAGLNGDFANEMYLFINANGGISLATPNYAGNVDEADKDVMLEYLVGTFTPTTESEKPYLVDVESLKGKVPEFNHQDTNVTIKLNADDQTLTFVTPDGEFTQKFEFEAIDTKEIEIFSADLTGSRKVKVNNYLKPVESTPEQTGKFGGDYYLFMNAKGNLSLIVPDYDMPGEMPFEFESGI